MRTETPLPLQALLLLNVVDKGIAMLNKLRLFFVISAMSSSMLFSYDHDIIIEGKGAYFLSTNSTFKNIYNNGGGIYGAELTAKIYDHWYGFISADFFSKKGKSIGLCSPTKVNIIDVGIGLKYLLPFEYGDFYIGLGALPTYLRTKDCSPYVVSKQKNWGCGGIAKAGAYINLPRSFIMDLFFDYSFVKMAPHCCSSRTIITHKAILNGCWFGVGLGYRFK